MSHQEEICGRGRTRAELFSVWLLLERSPTVPNPHPPSCVLEGTQTITAFCASLVQNLYKLNKTEENVLYDFWYGMGVPGNLRRPASLPEAAWQVLTAE